jgi:hypothetical protein
MLQKKCLQENKIMAIHQPPENPEVMWNALQYGWAMGAPVTPALEAAFAAKRVGTRATLLCFHVAAKRGQAEEIAPEHAAMWAAMGRVPPELVGKIVVHADFEIAETLYRSHRSLPTRRSVILSLPAAPTTVWVRDEPALADAVVSTFPSVNEDGYSWSTP